MSPEIENPNIVARELVESYGQAYNLLIDNGWDVAKDEYTDEASFAGLTESHKWSIWLGDVAIKQMENLWLNDKLESLENYPPHIAREEAYNILKEGGWQVYWDDTLLGQGFINWDIFLKGDRRPSGIRVDWMSEEVMISPNRPLGILLSIGVIAWMVELLRR